MKQYLLDTSICVFFLRGRMDLDQWVKSVGRENCFISEITVFELMYGAENSSNPEASTKAVQLFLNGISVMPIFGVVKNYAKLKVKLRKLGKPMHDEFDLLIGVTALANNLVLVTDNEKHFVHIEGLEIENWFRS